MVRSHVFSNFLAQEFSVEDLLSDEDWTNQDMLITRNGSTEGLTQVDAGLATWRSMQLCESTVQSMKAELISVMTREMWLAW